MNKNKATEKLTHEEKSKATEIARLVARLPEQEQEKVYYMLKGSEIFNSRAMPRAAAQ